MILVAAAGGIRVARKPRASGDDALFILRNRDSGP